MKEKIQFFIQSIFILLFIFILPVKAQYEPNDPKWSHQWGHEKVKADYAWTISTGQREILVGVIDTGVNWQHPDLQGKIWTNPDEIAGNGIDDDGNGYVDDIRGWEFENKFMGRQTFNIIAINKKLKLLII